MCSLLKNKHVHHSNEIRRKSQIENKMSNQGQFLAESIQILKALKSDSFLIGQT